mgnify:CR=1 FL=1
MKKKNFPFTAILGQPKMKMGLLLNVIDPQIGGILLLIAGIVLIISGYIERKASESFY